MTLNSQTYRNNSELRPFLLTVRQFQVLELIANGYRSKEIAYRLDLKPETVNQHIQVVRNKLGAKTNAHAVALFLQYNFLMNY
jgi:two-component system, NarL family, response regulator YdfI